MNNEDSDHYFADSQRGNRPRFRGGPRGSVRGPRGGSRNENYRDHTLLNTQNNSRTDSRVENRLETRSETVGNYRSGARRPHYIMRDNNSNYNQRENRYSAHVQDIDISDSSQWPSIQESAEGRVSKRRSRGDKNSQTENQSCSAQTQTTTSTTSINKTDSAQNTEIRNIEITDRNTKNNEYSSMRNNNVAEENTQNTEDQREQYNYTQQDTDNQNTSQYDAQNRNGQNTQRTQNYRNIPRDISRQNPNYSFMNNTNDFSAQTQYFYPARGNRGRNRYAHTQTRNYNYTPRRYNRGYPNIYQQPMIQYADSNLINGYMAYPVPILDDRTKEYEAMRQVEYYFSAQNLGTDMFMRARMDDDGWIDLSLVFKFKRIQRLDMSYDDFLRAVASSDQLEVNKIDNRVRTIHNPGQWVLDAETKEKLREKSNLAKSAHVQSSNSSQNSDNGDKNTDVSTQARNFQNYTQNFSQTIAQNQHIQQNQNNPGNSNFLFNPAHIYAQNQMYLNNRPNPRFYGTFSFVPQYYPYQFGENEQYYPYFPGMPMYDPNYANYYENSSAQDQNVEPEPESQKVAENVQKVGEIQSETAQMSLSEERTTEAAEDGVEKIVAGMANLKVDSPSSTTIAHTL